MRAPEPAPCKFIVVEQSATSIGGHYFAYSAMIAQAAGKAGFDVAVLCNKRLTIEVASPVFTLHPCFTHSWGESETRGPQPFAAGQFAFELDGALRAVGAGRGDIVFIHTCAYAELQEILLYLCDLPPEDRHPTFHILLRYDPEPLLHRLLDFAPAFAFIKQSPLLGEIVHFHSDTERLAEIFSRETGHPFEVCPIPCDQTEPAAEEHESKAWGHGDDLVITYLGDARIEKGFGYLPEALIHLRKSAASPVAIRYIIQSNFNTEQGEPGMREALSRLEALKEDITFMREPLGPEAYMRALHDSDIVLLPYDPLRYRNRSSGILVEALCAGKVVVTTQGSWMEAQVTPEQAVIISDASALGAGLLDALTRYPALKAAAEAGAAGWKARSTRDAMLRHLLDHAADSAVPKDQSPMVLMVMDGGAIVLENGASRVFDLQMRYLKAAGYRVSGLFLSHDYPAAATSWKQRLMRRLHAHRFERIFLGGFAPFEATSAVDVQISEALRTQDHSIAQDLLRVSAYTVTGQAAVWFKTFPPDAVLLNYVTNLPILDNLGLSHLPVLCEMHDLQAHQKAIYGQRAVSNADIAAEMALLARCRSIIALNHDEARFVSNALPEGDVFVGGIVFPEKTLRQEILAGARDCADIVASARPMRAKLKFALELPAVPDPDVLKLIGFQDRLDLFFVSSAHNANLPGLNWFFREVYAPYLAQHDVSVVIAGSIANLGPFPQFPRIVFVGQVDTLDPLYAAARVVVLPITEGAGCAVKAYEAIARHKPVVATPFALRGIAADISSLEPADTASDFAARILKLLASKQARQQAVQASAELSAQLCAFSPYVRVMDKAFATAIGSKALMLASTRQVPAAETPAGAGRPGQARVIEWDRDFQTVSAALRAIVLSQPIPGLSTLEAMGEPVTPCLAAMIEALYRHEAALADPESRVFLGPLLEARRSLPMEEVRAVLDAAITGRSGDARAILANAHLEARLTLEGIQAISLTASPDIAAIAEGDNHPRQRSWRIARRSTLPGSDYFVMRFAPDAHGNLVQEIPLAPEMRVLGRPLFYRWTFATDAAGARIVRAVKAEISQGAGRSGWLDRLRDRIRLRQLRSEAFDSHGYLLAYPDIVAARVNPLHHFLKHGAAEGRNPNALFDTSWYLKRYLDVAVSRSNPLDHYLLIGARLGYDPGPGFSTRGYLDTYPDVERAGLNPLIHYLHHGIKEGRNPLSSTFGIPAQSLFIPQIGSLRDRRWIEIDLAERHETSSPLRLLQDGRPLMQIAAGAGRQNSLRFECPPHDHARPFGLACISVESVKSGIVDITGIRIGLTNCQYTGIE